MWFVPFVIGAFVEIISAEKVMQPLRRVQHVVIGAARALVVLIIFPRRIEFREFGVKLVVRSCGAG